MVIDVDVELLGFMDIYDEVELGIIFVTLVKGWGNGILFMVYYYCDVGIVIMWVDCFIFGED